MVENSDLFDGIGAREWSSCDGVVVLVLAVCCVAQQGVVTSTHSSFSLNAGHQMSWCAYSEKGQLVGCACQHGWDQGCVGWCIACTTHMHQLMHQHLYQSITVSPMVNYEPEGGAVWRARQCVCVWVGPSNKCPTS